MARIEESNPKEFWDIYANRSSGQFPEGTPISLIADHANYQYGNPYPELDEEGWGVHPITKRTQGGLSFNTNLGASMTFVGPEEKRIDVEPRTDITISYTNTNFNTDVNTDVDVSAGNTFIDIVKNPWVLGGIALAAFILFKK